MTFIKVEVETQTSPDLNSNPGYLSLNTPNLPGGQCSTQNQYLKNAFNMIDRSQENILPGNLRFFII